jgi:hypothetical protein
MVLAEVRKSVYFSLLAGNLGRRKVRTGLRPPPASLNIPLYSFQCGRNPYFAAQLAGIHQVHLLYLRSDSAMCF